MLALSLCAALLACGDDGAEAETGGNEAGDLELGRIAACEMLQIPPAEGRGGSWTVEGPTAAIGFDLPADFEAGWLFRVPVVVVDTPMELVSSKGGRVRFTAEASAPPSGYPEGMAAGCAPFAHGVASGDPSESSVLLWTRLSADMSGRDPESEVALQWVLATDAAFASPVASGGVLAAAENDFAVQVEATGLTPATTYYYRFKTPDGLLSPVGRTRTAPAAGADHLRLAVVSCSSIYSGFFNGYRRIAERLDLDGLVHVGDYIYDFVDEDEQVRVPDPYPTQPENLVQWRDVHAYHLSDPDLRAARAAHPWVMLWDNHDVDAGKPEYNGAVQAFREWNPVTPAPSGAGEDVIYRRVAFGDLIDLIVIDVLLFRDQDLVPGSDEPSFLGTAQYDWFTSELQNSSARWRIVANQKPVAPILGLLTVIGGSTWNGYPAARDQLFAFLRDEGISNTLFLSGDAHITVVADLNATPDDPDAYDPATGEGSVAAEFQPGSMSRGNVDEFFPDMPQLPGNLEEQAPGDNPHYRFLDLTRHGYGLMDITRERIVAELWYSEILQRSDEETFAGSLEMRQGTQHWEREVSDTPTSDGDEG